MSTHVDRRTPATPDPVRLDDATLHARAHDGDERAYATLSTRHFHAARRLAVHLGAADQADQVVADALAAVVGIRPGPDDSPRDVRGLLFSTIRHEVRHRTSTAVRGVMPPTAFSHTFASLHELPPTWRAALWHTDVEGLPHHEVAETLDVPTPEVTALVYRARAGLRDRTLQRVEDTATSTGDECPGVRSRLAGVLGRTATVPDQELVHAHLSTCEPCMAVYLGLQHADGPSDPAGH